MDYWGGGGGGGAKGMLPPPLKLFGGGLPPSSYAYETCCYNIANYLRSDDSVVDNTLDYQTRDREIDLPLLRSLG